MAVHHKGACAGRLYFFNCAVAMIAGLFNYIQGILQ